MAEGNKVKRYQVGNGTANKKCEVTRLLGNYDLNKRKAHNEVVAMGHGSNYISSLYYFKEQFFLDDVKSCL